MTVEFTVRGAVVRAHATAGRTVAELLHEARVPLSTACGGRGVCGRCAVILHEGRFECPDGVVDIVSGQPRSAPACRTKVLGSSARVEVPDRSLVERGARIADDFVLPPFVFESRQRRYTVDVPAGRTDEPSSDVERFRRALAAAGGPEDAAIGLEAARAIHGSLVEGAGRIAVSCGPFGGGIEVTAAGPDMAQGPHLAVAADIGTTTVVAMLIDLDRGRILGRASQYNQQIRRADDVAARISFCRSGDDLRAMQQLVVNETLQPLVDEVCRAAKCEAGRIVRIAVAGNTVMMHLLLGLPPGGIGAIPFHPVARRHPAYRAADIGLKLHPRAVLDVVPSMSGHVGGDLTADACAARLLDRRGVVMLVDIGTNGEILLWNGKRLLSAATAAGPAFEGAGLHHGMRAATGAVDHVRWTPELKLEWTTIGGGPAGGLCGSAIIDFVAQSFKAGMLDTCGRFDMERLREAGAEARVERRGRTIHACRIVPAEATSTGHPLTVSEADIAEILKAKAAIHGGIATMLAAAGLQTADIDTLVLAGGFARHIHLRHAAWMGLLPDLPPDRIEVIGNGSLAGALMALGDPGAPAEFERILAAAEAVDLNLRPEFEAAYIDSMLLPHAEPAAFDRAMAEMRAAGDRP